MAWSIFELVAPRKQKTPRRHARFEAPNLRCTIGEAIDLSQGGMRVRSAAKPAVKPGDVLALWVEAGRKRLHINGRVAWVRRDKKSFLVGIEFTDVDKRHQTAIEQLARFGCFVANQQEPKVTTDAAGRTADAVKGGSGRGDAAGVRAGVEVEDLYKILGLGSAASQDEITSAFRKLARQVHPDHVAADETDANKARANERFTVLHKAYSVLRDPALRKRYDSLLTGAGVSA